MAEPTEIVVELGQNDWLGIPMDGWVAIVTFGLALVTGLLFWWTRQAVIEARKASEAAMRAIELAEADLVLSVMPVLTATVPRRSGVEWVVELLNEGLGIAVNATAWIEVSGDRVSWPSDQARILPRQNVIRPLRTDAKAELSVASPGLVPDGVEVRIVVEYLDLQGRKYRAVHRHVPPSIVSLSRLVDGGWAPLLASNPDQSDSPGIGQIS